ncbi:MAG: hypothetical protein HQL82_03185 [Magnetococcales bacterium]|nr:hypothetical protein [Magnetococcales bacterium]
MKRFLMPLLLGLSLCAGQPADGLADQAGYEQWLKTRDRNTVDNAAVNGHSYAMIELGRCYIQAQAGCTLNHASGVALWEKAVAQGEGWLADELLLTIAEGSQVEQPEPGWSFHWSTLCKVAGVVREKGMENQLGGRATSYVGLCFLGGKGGIKEDPGYGLKMLETAAMRHKLADAAAILADIFYNGYYGFASNQPKSSHYARLAASLGHKAAPH